jgi:uncharacterized protein (DUF2062 family)
MRGTWLHSRFGDRILDKALWKPTRESLARAWLVGFPVTMMPFLPIQSVLACIVAIFIRGNLLLCIALQFLSTPLTAPVHLPACYFVGEVVRGRSTSEVWNEVTDSTSEVFTGDSLISLYLGAAVLGITIGMLGYVLLKNFWRLPAKSTASVGLVRDKA